MEKIKEFLQTKQKTVNWGAIGEDMQLATGEKFPELEGESQHFMFNSWDELELLILHITGKAFSAGISAITSEAKNPFSSWYDEFIQKIKP